MITYLVSAPETCSDKLKNQGETDVDCGGGICPKCNDTRTCKNASDCLSNRCNNNTCARRCLTVLTSTITSCLISAPETCNDKIKNQDETDVDCGGGICPRCNNTRICKNAFDCLSNTCKNNTCARKCLIFLNFSHDHISHFSPRNM